MAGPALDGQRPRPSLHHRDQRVVVELAVLVEQVGRDPGVDAVRLQPAEDDEGTVDQGGHGQEHGQGLVPLALVSRLAEVARLLREQEQRGVPLHPGRDGEHAGDGDPAAAQVERGPREGEQHHDRLEAEGRDEEGGGQGGGEEGGGPGHEAATMPRHQVHDDRDEELESGHDPVVAREQDIGLERIEHG